MTIFRLFSTIIFSFILVLSAPSLSVAQGFDIVLNADDIGGTDIGQTIPHSLSAVDQNGDKQDFETMKSHKGLLLVFIRSVSWCPYCQLQVIEMNNRLSDFQSKGYDIAVVTYEPSEKSKPFSDKNQITIPILADTDLSIIKSFNILNEDYEQGSAYYGAPHPAIFVISSDRRIVSRYQEDGFKDRPSLDVILDELAP